MELSYTFYDFALETNDIFHLFWDLIKIFLRYTVEILESARSISEHAEKKQIDELDIQFAIDSAGINF